MNIVVLTEHIIVVFLVLNVLLQELFVLQIINDVLQMLQQVVMEVLHVMNHRL